jgi:hypothetical protein
VKYNESLVNVIAKEGLARKRKIFFNEHLVMDCGSFVAT